MKLPELIEMTMKVSSYEQLGEYLHMFDSYKTDGVHVGDIEKFKVFKISADVDRYAVFFGDDTKAIAYFIMKPTLSMLDVIFVSKPFRKMGLFSAILFFIKRNEGYNKIILGNQHSQSTITSVSRIYQRFDRVYWQKDEITEPYDPSTIDKYYGLKPTGWNLVFENDYVFKESEWPKFFDGLTLSTYYFPLLEDE